MSRFNWEYPWKMWTEELKPTNNISEAHFLYIEDDDAYEAFILKYKDKSFYGFNYKYGVYRAGMWIWSADAHIYMSVSDCEDVLGDFNIFDAYANDEAWEEN